MNDGTVSRHDRIRMHTPQAVNDDIQQRIYDSVACHRGRPADVIQRRIEQCEREWDVDRAVFMNFAVLGGAALYAGYWRDRRWLTLPLVQVPFLLLHVTAGWCPPLPVFRAMRFRSRHEIEAEVSALRALLRDAPATREEQPVEAPRRDGAGMRG